MGVLCLVCVCGVDAVCVVCHVLSSVLCVALCVVCCLVCCVLCSVCSVGDLYHSLLGA